MTSDASVREAIAIGLLVASDGRLLLQLRDNNPGITNPNRWGFFGGHLEPGERPPEAFLREMQEELGWQPKQFELWSTEEVDGDGWHLTSHAFAAHLDAPLDELTLGEGQRFELFPPDALPDGIVESDIPVIQRFAATRAYKRAQRTWDIRTATALLIDTDGRFLLQHRDDKPEIMNPGLWGSFGGAIEDYETPDDGFLREIEEELSWRPAGWQQYGAYPYAMPGGGDALIYVYAALVDVPQDRLILGEGQGLGFFAVDSLPNKIVPDLRPLIERFARSDDYDRIKATAL